MVDALVERIRGEVDFTARCIATGGLAPLIATETRTIEATDEPRPRATGRSSGGIPSGRWCSS